MKNKFSGFIASGQAHSKISLGDIFKDSYGYRVKIISVDDRRVPYLRDGYDFECVMPSAVRKRFHSGKKLQDR